METEVYKIIFNLFSIVLSHLDFFDDLNDVFVVEDVILADLLRLMLDGRAPHESVFHLLDDGTMDLVTEILNLKSRRIIW